MANKCKSPKEFESFMKKQVTLFLVPCCFIKNGRFDLYKLNRRIKSLKKIEANLLIRIRALEMMYKSQALSKD